MRISESFGRDAEGGEGPLEGAQRVAMIKRRRRRVIININIYNNDDDGDKHIYLVVLIHVYVYVYVSSFLSIYGGIPLVLWESSGNI